MRAQNPFGIFCRLRACEIFHELEGRREGGAIPVPVQYLRYTQVGIQFFATIAICGGAGWWLDVRLGILPVLTSVLGLAGFAIALYHLVREVDQK